MLKPSSGDIGSKADIAGGQSKSEGDKPGLTLVEVIGGAGNGNKAGAADDTDATPPGQSTAAGVTSGKNAIESGKSVLSAASSEEDDSLFIGPASPLQIGKNNNVELEMHEKKKPGSEESELLAEIAQAEVEGNQIQKKAANKKLVGERVVAESKEAKESQDADAELARKLKSVYGFVPGNRKLEIGKHGRMVKDRGLANTRATLAGAM